MKATDKCRTGIPDAGSKLKNVVNESAYGAAKATERYGYGTQTFPAPPSQTFPQFKQDQCVDRTYNTVPVNSWLRGGGSKQAEGKPNFHRGYRGK